MVKTDKPSKCLARTKLKYESLILAQNAGGVPNTCKSNEALVTESFGRKMLETEWRTGE